MDNSISSAHEFISVTEYCLRRRVSSNWAYQLLRLGKIPGAKKDQAGEWQIPDNGVEPDSPGTGASEVRNG